MPADLDRFDGRISDEVCESLRWDTDMAPDLDELDAPLCDETPRESHAGAEQFGSFVNREQSVCLHRHVSSEFKGPKDFLWSGRACMAGRIRGRKIYGRVRARVADMTALAASKLSR